MKAEDVVFDEDYYINGVLVDGQDNPVGLSISDALEASDEILLPGYRERIANFVNASRQWFPLARGKIMSEVGNDAGLELMTVFVLFEQAADSSLFGLLFNLDADREHGRGMVLDGDSFKILAYGEAHVAFEGL